MHSRTKVVAVLSACLALGIVLSGCAGSTKAPTLNFSGAQALDAGQSLNITSNENVKWSLSGTGSLASQTPTSVTYNAPAVGSFVIPRGKGTSAAVPFGASADPTATITATSTANTSKVTTLTINLAEPPVITTASLPNGVVGTAYNQTIAVTGGAGKLTFTVSTGTLPAGLTLGSGTITGTPTAAGTSTFTVKVTDSSAAGALSATQSYSITVNQAPAITSANSATFVVGMAGTFTVKTTGSPTPSLSESGTLPNGLMFTDNGDGTGTLSGTPAPGTAANYAITFTATNIVGSTPQNFTLTVGQPPAITSGSSTTFTVGTKGTFTVTATGFPIPSLTNAGATLPSGVMFVDNKNGTGTLSGTPVAGTGKQYAISFTASNGVGSNATQSFTLTVNEAPSFTSANNATFAVLAMGTFTVMTYGYPAPALNESGSLPSGVGFKDNGNGTGTLSGTPASGTNGIYPITFTATSSVGGPATQSFTLTVTTAPVFTSGTSTTFTVGTNGSFTVTATGTPSPTITESGALPNSVTFTAGTGSATLSGTPAAGTGGTYPITFTATSSSGTNQQSFTLTVDEAPTITSANSTTFTVGTNGTFTVQTTGFPQDPITETGPLPSGVTFVDNGNNTATLSGMPAAGTAGSYPIIITASNGVAPNATQDFTLTVSASTCGSGSESMLNGGYAFVLKGFDGSGNPALVGGVLTFNGSGSITAGAIDMNLAGGVQPNLNVTSGTYSIGSDQRGCMTIITSAGTQDYRLSVGNITSGVASTAHVVDFDTTGPFTAGSMYLQSGGPFSASQFTGSYAFGASSIQNTAVCDFGVCGGKHAVVGVITFNGSSGGISGGSEDINQNGILDRSSTNTTWPATSPINIATTSSYTMTANGRGTLSLAYVGVAGTSDSVFYAVSTSQALFMTSDAQTAGTIVAGQAFLQSGTFTANPLSGTYVGYDSGLGSGAAGTDRTDLYLLGPLTSGSGTLTGTQLRNDAGAFTSGALAGTYSASSAGRVLVTGGGSHAPVLYLVNTSEAFVLAGNASVDFGFFQSQSGGPFSSSTPSGTYAYGAIDPEVAASSINSGVVVFANPDVTVTEDDNSDGTLTVGKTQSLTYSVDSTGLGYIPANCTPGTNCQTLFYIISPTKAVVMNATSSTPKITIADK